MPRLPPFQVFLHLWVISLLFKSQILGNGFLTLSKLIYVNTFFLTCSWVSLNFAWCVAFNDLWTTSLGQALFKWFDLTGLAVIRSAGAAGQILLTIFLWVKLTIYSYSMKEHYSAKQACRAMRKWCSNKSHRALAQRLCTFLFENSTAIQSNDRQLKENHYVFDIICWRQCRSCRLRMIIL